MNAEPEKPLEHLPPRAGPRVEPSETQKQYRELREVSMLEVNRRLVLAGLSAFPALQVFGKIAFASGQSEATIVLSPSEMGASYNPFTAASATVVHSVLYDTLVVQDSDFKIYPHLAEAWDVSADGREWMFTLRKGVKFHDGEKFSAETIAWWVPKYAGGDNEYMLEAIETVKVLEDHKVAFTMKRAEPNLLNNLARGAMSIPSPKAVKDLGDGYGVAGAVGTGSYKFESFSLSQETVVVRNEDYAWPSILSQRAGAATIERLIFREIPESSSQFLELKTGGVDMLLNVPAEFVSQVQENTSLHVQPIPSVDTIFLAINTSVEPFTDIEVRKAVALSVNQKDILTGIFGGIGTEAHNFLPTALEESRVDPKYDISYDSEQANAILDAAGWVRAADGIREKKGNRLTVKLWSTSESQIKRVTEAVQEQLRQVGIEAEISTFDSGSINDLFKKNEHQLAVSLTGWANADNLDWHFNGENLGYPNISMWNDAKAEELRKKAMTESVTWDERVANFRQYHEYILSQFVFSPIYHPAQNIAYNKERIRFPEKVRGVWVEGQTILDMDVVV